MPIEKLVNDGKRVWALWKITESEDEFRALQKLKEIIPSTITNEQKRLEWLAGRVITHCLLAQFNLSYNGLTKNEFGKPFLLDYPFHISLSHSFPYVAAIIDKHNEVGIDLEQPKEKLFRVASRVFSPDELKDAGNDLTKHCIYWCAKEALIKIYGKKDLILAENLRISPFPLENQGEIIGRIIVTDSESLITLYYQVFPGFVLVFSKEKDPE
jgi:4'-phosphopantetheinyl transferase